MPNYTVQLTDELERFVSRSIEKGGYKDASEVVRSALHSLEREQDHHAEKLTALREAIDEGDSSGLARGDVFAQTRRSIEQEARLLAQKR